MKTTVLTCDRVHPELTLATSVIVITINGQRTNLNLCDHHTAELNELLKGDTKVARMHRFTCAECSTNYKDSRSLGRHVVAMHQGKGASARQVPPGHKSCPECPAIVMTSNYVHEQSHRNQRKARRR